METKDFDISDFKGCSIRSFTLREMHGRDSIAAAQRSVKPGEPNPIYGFQHRSQIIADAIVRVNGADVPTPYVAWEDWNIRTQTFVERAYDEMNGVSKEEMERFLGRHGLKPSDTQEASAPPTSSSGSK